MCEDYVDVYCHGRVSVICCLLGVHWLIINRLWVRLQQPLGSLSFLPPNRQCISVKALKVTQNINRNQWHGLILSLSTTELLTEGALLHLCPTSGNGTNVYRLVFVVIVQILCVFIILIILIKLIWKANIILIK